MAGKNLEVQEAKDVLGQGLVAGLNASGKAKRAGDVCSAGKLHAGFWSRLCASVRDVFCTAAVARPSFANVRRMVKGAACEKGQGTTEYAILVGILVVIAVLAIAVFRPKIQELWDSISSSINAL